MSDISRQVRPAFFAKLNVAQVTNLAKGGVHHQLAPAKAGLPYVIFQRAAADDVIYAFGMNVIAEDEEWLVKSLADEDSDPQKEPQQLNEEILAAAEAAIGDSLMLGGGRRTLAVYRLRDMPEYSEIGTDGKAIYHNGFYVRVVAA